MKRRLLLLSIVLMSCAVAVSAQTESATEADAAAIKEAVGNYLNNGWFASDPEAMRKALHPVRDPAGE